MIATARTLLAILSLTLTAAQGNSGEQRRGRDWAATLRTDARAFHDTVVVNHPGPVNRLDPGFARRNDAALALAIRRAGAVHDVGGYVAAMRGYVASFEDGHVQFGTTPAAPALATRWPGFLTGYDAGGRQVVVTRADDAPVPLGARLIACDGVPADRLAAAQVGAFRGRWSLASQRLTQGGRLFVDAGNPFVARPRACRFAVADKTRDVTLTWRALPDAEFWPRLGETAPRATPPFGARTLADGTRWFSMSSFDGDPAGEAAKALVPMIAALKRDRAAVAASPRIVLDVRGNGGGSSDWSRQIAEILWGAERVHAAQPESEAVDWRVSAANLAVVRDYQQRWAKAPDVSPEAREWADRAVAGMTAALAAGKPLWRETDPASPPPSAGERVSPPKARVLILTDWSCASACLDAVDFWRALGAVQVGQETSADTLYMDLREDMLPSGMATVDVPMKVYRGRKRGSNVPWTPVHRYLGDMRDTAAVERWIARLPG